MEQSCGEHPELPLVAECGTINIGSHTVKRYLKLEAEIKALFDKFTPEFVIIESNFQFQNVKTFAVLNQLRGAVLLLAYHRGIAVEFVDNNAAKKKMLGSTKWWNGEAYVGVTKKMMEAAVGKTICEHSAKPEDDNAADAIAIGFTYWDVQVNPDPLPRKPVAPKQPRRKAA